MAASVHRRGPYHRDLRLAAGHGRLPRDPAPLGSPTATWHGLVEDGRLMSAPHADPLIEGYLARLRAAAADLTLGARDELTEDVRAHIAEARTREAEETDATILNILDRLGDPEELVA